MDRNTQYSDFRKERVNDLVSAKDEIVNINQWGLGGMDDLSSRRNTINKMTVQLIIIEMIN